MRWISVVLAFAVLLAAGAPTAEEKRISVYSVAANYSLPVISRAGHDYLGLLEVLDPLGSVSARTQGHRWKLRYNNVEAEFTAGSTRARVRGKDFDLPASFLLENNHGLVPLASLTMLLPRFLGGPIIFHDTARRLFVGDVTTQFTAELSRTTPPRLVLSFSSPVNPMISTEPGKLRMLFTREPLVRSGSPVLMFDDKTIPSAIYEESNGVAELDVSGNLPLMASFSTDRQTITIAPAPQAAPQPTAHAQPAPAPPASVVAPVTPTPEPPAPALNAAPAAAQPISYFAVVDASHGGDERGAALSKDLPEKDVTLAVARRLRQELQNRGLSVLMLRDSDATLGLDQRAAMANSSHASIYICVHVSSQGTGVRLYTALMPAAGDSHGPFLDWNTAQTSALPLSQTLVENVAAELQKKKVSVKTLPAPLRPLNNVTSAVFAVELSPPGNDMLEVASPAYQQLVAAAVVNGVTSWRDRQGAPR